MSHSEGRRLYNALPWILVAGAVFAMFGDTVVQALARRPLPPGVAAGLPAFPAVAVGGTRVQGMTEDEFEESMEWIPEGRPLTPEEIGEGLDKLAGGAHNGYVYEMRLGKEPKDAVAAVARERIAKLLPLTAANYERFIALAEYLPEEEVRAHFPAVIEAYPAIKGTDYGPHALRQIATSGTNEGIQFYLAELRAEPDTELLQVGYVLNYGVFESGSLPLAGKAAIAAYLREIALDRPEEFVGAGLVPAWLKADRIGATRDLLQPPLWQPEAPWHMQVLGALARERVALPEQTVRELVRRYAPSTAPGMPLPDDEEALRKVYAYAASVVLLARLHVPDVDPLIDDLYARGLTKPAFEAEALLLGVTDPEAVVAPYRDPAKRPAAPESIRHFLTIEECLLAVEEEGTIYMLAWFEGDPPEIALIAALEYIRAGRAIVAIRDTLALFGPEGASPDSDVRMQQYEAFTETDRKRLLIVLDRLNPELDSLSTYEVVLAEPETFRTEPPRALPPYTTKRPRR